MGVSSKFLIASIVANLLLAVSSYFLFNSNIDLNRTSGEQVAQISGLRATSDNYKTQVAQCVKTQEQLIVTHKQQIEGFRSVFANYQRDNADRLEQLMLDRGKIEATLRGIKMPEQRKEAEDRIAAINTMIDGYVTELNK